MTKQQKFYSSSRINEVNANIHMTDRKFETKGIYIQS